MGRMFDALKQAEAKRVDVPSCGVDEPSSGEHLSLAQEPLSKSRPSSVVEPSLTPPAAAPPVAKAAAPPATPPENMPSLPWPTQSLVDPLVGGDWLALVAGADLRPGSRLGGQYRRLRDRMLSQLPRGVAAAIVFSSPERNLGTTTTVVHLACVAAEVAAGDVLIVDSHPQNSAVAAKLNIDAEFGLADVLAGRATWQQAVVRVPPGRVHVLDSGPSTSLDELLQSPPEVLAALLADLKRRYRVVLIDGGTTDNELLSRWAVACDGAYLMLELSATSPDGATRAVEQLRAAGAQVLGCVLARGGRAA